MWHRIPIAVGNEQDRRTIVGILASCGLSVRIVAIKETPKSAKKYFVEYKEEAGT